MPMFWIIVIVLIILGIMGAIGVVYGDANNYRKLQRKLREEMERKGEK